MSDRAAFLRGYELHPRSSIELMDAALALAKSDPGAVLVLLIAPSLASSLIDLAYYDESLETIAISLLVTVAVMSVPALAIQILWARRLCGGRPTFRSAAAEAVGRAPAVLLSNGISSALWLGGLILLIVPGLYLFLVFLVTTTALAFEPIGGLRSLRRSASLMSGHRLRLLGATLTPLVPIVVLAWAPIGFVSAPIDTILSVIAEAYLAALSFVAYVDLRSRKEGFAIAVLAARVEAATGA